MMNANSYFGTMIEVSTYYVYNLVYLCRSLLEQQIKLM